MSARLSRALVLAGVLALILPVAAMQAQPPGGTAPEASAPATRDRSVPFFGEYPVSGGMRVIVELEDPPLVAYRGGTGGLVAAARRPGGHVEVGSAEARRYLDYLGRKQEAFLDGLARALPKAQVSLYVDESGGEQALSYRIVFHGMTLNLPQADRNTLLQLAKLPGVKAIYPAREYEVAMDSSLPLLGLVTDATGNGFDPGDADAGLWDALGGHDQAGEGLKVALLDTGVAQDHPFFDSTGYTYPAGFPQGDARYTTPKVIVARGYYRADDPPVKPNPYDYGGHGSHTGGAIAGNYGTVATVGTLTQTVSGVAPKAYLMNYQLFYQATSGSESAWNPEILKAFDDLVADGADVASNSWSGADNLAPAVDPLIVAVNNMADAGIVPVFAAGNSGPGAGSVHPPATAEKAIAVGASTTARSFGASLDVTGPGTAPITLTNVLAIESSLSTPITDTFGPAGYVYVGRLEPSNSNGCSAYGVSATLAISGNVALISRGVCRFDQKVQYAQNAGAIAALVFNDIEGAPPFAMSGDSRDIPAFMVGHNQGQDLVAWEAANVGAAELQINHGDSRVSDAKAANVMAEFSGRGPFLDLLIKPDVVAPGVEVLSAYYDSSTDKVDGWGTIQGTSMATPHVAGAAVLLKQLHPAWSVAQIKSALMTTAAEDGLYNDYPQTEPGGVMDRGAGRIDLNAAVAPGLTSDRPSVSFGQVSPGEVVTVSVSATNVYTTSSHAYSIAISETGDVATVANFVLTTNVSSLVVSGTPATFDIIMVISGTAEAGDYEGAIWLRRGSRAAHIPVWVRVKPSSTTADVLVIDDDSSAYAYTDYVAYYTEALDNIGLSYDIWAADLMNYFYELGIPNLADLQQYRAVLWFTGDSPYSYVNIGASVARRHVMLDYLRSGGRLIVFGQDFSGYELGGSSGRAYLIPLGLATEIAKADAYSPASSEAPMAAIEGIPGSGFEGVLLDLGTPQTATLTGTLTGTVPLADGAGNQLHVDELTPQATYGGSGILRSLVPGSSDKGVVGVQRSSEPTLENQGVLPGPDYRAVYLAFGLEGVNNPKVGHLVYEGASSREQLLTRLFTFLWAEPTVGLSDVSVVNPYDPVTLVASPGFESTGTFQTADIARYRWDLGDRSGVVTTTVPTLTYYYNTVGVYPVRVELADAYGHRALAQATARAGYPVFLPVMLRGQ